MERNLLVIVASSSQFQRNMNRIPNFNFPESMNLEKSKLYLLSALSLNLNDVYVISSSIKYLTYLLYHMILSNFFYLYFACKSPSMLLL